MAHKDAFLEILKEQRGKNFEQLSQELKKSGRGPVVHAVFPRPGHEKKYAQDMRKQVVDLKNIGDAAWIDASTIAGHHGMMMRVVLTSEDQYTLYYSNTGCGLEEHPDFHPFG